MARNTKIVVTHGPALAGEERLHAALEAGADVVRLNLSHGDHDAHRAAIRAVRETARRVGRYAGILFDLRGPKIRVGELDGEPRRLVAGETVTLDPRGSGADRIPIDGHPALAGDTRHGQPILLDDGAIRLRVLDSGPNGVRCEVVAGGDLRSRKGVNLPETSLTGLESPTEKDWRDLALGLDEGVDWVALSFVRAAGDVARLRRRIRDSGADVPLIAKIERREALADLEAIVAEADGLMVARGDLGVETELAEVALRQKEIIRAGNRQGKVVVTATQMLESMMRSPTPTRAEVSDISNAIFDGTDAVMLSGETAVGAHPLEAISFMATIAERTEAALDARRVLAERPFLDEVPDAVAHAACVTACQVGAAALLCLTRSGLTARLVSRYRPGCPIIAVSPAAETAHRLALVWGAQPLHLDVGLQGDALIEAALAAVRERGLVAPGARVVVTAGMGAGDLAGRTNLLRVEVL
ncbi:MAG: pyruvate kinase [Candidatus Eisenbacteria bacterium]|uniref:Pyruvate kinase n=1 Tax=Eiseniibacteriota bacterium TaxID=2212470 RepID=A0A938BQB3_UNCEI|nr:pyruvate kinase [Candidatus Eisenbacteria bacterium]